METTPLWWLWTYIESAQAHAQLADFEIAYVTANVEGTTSCIRFG